ncbi:MAG TPA: hypothetical protein ENJ00_11275 [Phycisphaerales bacterium]|nr:hypothetical protein [Phycisphaerales bacterium]
MMAAADVPALPLWVVVPPAAGLMLILAGYVLAMRHADMPASRRRIRTAGSIVMMATQPLIVYLFGIGTSANPRPFMLTWAMLIGLLGMLVVLAMLDAINSSRLMSHQRRELRRERRRMQEDVYRIVSEHRQRDVGEPNLRLADTDENEPR